MATSTLHSIKANLYLNLLTDDPNDYSARVDSEKSLSTRDICNSAVTRGGAATTAESMEYHVDLFFKEMGYQLSNGFSVNTGYFTAGALIKGVFNSPGESFDPNKHSVLFQFNQGALLREEIQNINVEIQGVADTGTVIMEVVDVKSGSVNDVVTPGRNLRIRGTKVKIDGDHPEVGVSFVNTSTGDVVKVDPTDIVENMPSELIIFTPELEAGTYNVKVTTQFSGNSSSLLKDPRTTVFEHQLTVQ
ncbi:DNA-binding domain-containing protein [Marinilabilia sp.]